MRGTVNDIAVVGGGITGAFVAYLLARDGVGVTLIERDEIGGHASADNPGGLNPLHGPAIPGAMQAVALEAFRLHAASWGEVQRLSGIDFSPRKAARLHVALDEADLATLERVREPYASAPGFSARWVEREELRELEPRLSPAVRRGLLTEGNARVDSASYTRALAVAAQALGARAVSADARDLVTGDGRVGEVVLDSGSVACDGVVLAVGPWCERPAAWLGTRLPVEPVKGEMLLVEAPGGAVSTDIAWRDAAVYDGGEGQAWLGGTDERVGFQEAPSAAGRASILSRVARVMPELSGARVLKQVAALRPVTPDGIPIAGLVDGWQNVYAALGSGRKGVLLSAAVARAVVDLLTRGRTQVPIGPCSPQRWLPAAAR
jgi:glycine oxidase